MFLIYNHYIFQFWVVLFKNLVLQDSKVLLENFLSLKEIKFK